MKSIAEQCEDRGQSVDMLLGMTAGEIRALGYDVHPDMGDERTFDRERVGDNVDTTALGRRTGYIMRPGTMKFALAY